MTTADARKVGCMGCSQQCGLLMHIENDRITKMTGDSEHPVSQGFICPKGANAPTQHYDGARLHRPLKRVGRRGGGHWEEIDWDKALDEIADKIIQLTDVYGRETLAHSVGTAHASDWGLGERFMNIFDSPNTVSQNLICYTPNAVAEALTYGWGPTMVSPPTPGATRCDVIWGMRPNASGPLVWRAVRDAKKSGAKLLVIDVKRTKEASQADLFLQVHPGSDAALALGILNVILTENLYDHAFVEHHTVGFDALAHRCAEYTLDLVSEMTSVPTEQIVAAARMLAENGPTSFQAGNGLCHAGTNAVQAGRAVACLIAVTGNLNVSGGHALPGPPQDIVAGGNALLCDKLSPTQRVKRLGAETFPMLGDGYNDLSEAVAGAWWGDRHALSWCSHAHEPTLWHAIRTGQPYPVKALILQCHNAVGAGANTQAAADALASDNLELLVSQDLFMNQTSSLADYVLPAAHWLEKPFFSTGLGYLGYAGDFVEAKPAALTAEHPSDYQLWRDLGLRLGQEEYWPQTAEEFWDSLLQPAGLSFDTVASHVGPLVGERAARTTVHQEGQRRSYGTPSGLVELHSSLLEKWGLDPLPAFQRPGIFTRTGQDFPLTLTTGGRQIEGFHQDAQQTPQFRRKRADPVANIHPSTAADYEVVEGDWIEISTPIGSAYQRVYYNSALAFHTVEADRWWYPECGQDTNDPFGVLTTNINMCTDDSTDSCDEVLGSWLLRGLPCRIHVSR